MNAPLSPTLAKGCLDMLEDYYGLVVTTEQLEAVLAKDPDFRRDLVKYNSPTDTADREVLSHLVIKEILGDQTGRGWPTYGDGDAYRDEFYAKLRQAAPLKGFTFNG